MAKPHPYAIAVVLALLLGTWTTAQTNQPKEKFSAVAIRSDEFTSGAGRVLFDISRWSTPQEVTRFVNALKEDGPEGMLKQLRSARPVGTIRTPDTLAYDLRMAHQTKASDGGRDIVLATDRPMSFWEAWHQPRTTNYPFTVVQMHFDADGRGKGTLSLATKIIPRGNTIELENFSTSPVMLTKIEARKDD
jgi:hypothetical protein